MSTYGEYLADLKASYRTAYEYIPKMCDALREEDPHLSNSDIRDRVTKDCLDVGISKGTIMNNIPAEYKDPDNVEKGKKGAAKKKEKETEPMEILTDGNLAHDSGAGQSLIESEKPKLGSSGSKEQEHKEIPEWTPEGEEDIEVLKKHLEKYVDDSRLKEAIIANKDKEIGQLNEALKKTSFTTATDYTPPPKTFQWPEPDESNTFVWMETSFDELRRRLGPLKAGGNTPINVYLERVV